jgi:hypothetical protein
MPWGLILSGGAVGEPPGGTRVMELTLRVAWVGGCVGERPGGARVMELTLRVAWVVVFDGRMRG